MSPCSRGSAAGWHTAAWLLCTRYRCAVSQQKCTAALVWAKCIPHCSVELCKTGSQQACIIAIAPVEICSSYRCAVSQLKSTAALIKAKCIPHCSVVLCKTGSQQACVTAIAPVEICSSQVCSEPAQMYCSTGLGKIHSPLFSRALQNRLTAGLCHCNSTCGDLLFTGVQ